MDKKNNIVIYRKQLSTVDVTSPKSFKANTSVSPPVISKQKSLVQILKKPIQKDKNESNNLIVPNLTFKKENQYVISDNCQICNIKFGGLSLEIRHNCKICGKSICGKCSKKKANNERICDICFLRLSSHRQGKRRRDYLKYREKYLEKLKQLTGETKLKIQHYEIQALEIKNSYKSDEEKRKDEINKLIKEQEKQEEILLKRVENKQRLQKTIDTDKSILSQKTTENEKFKNKIDNLMNQISDQEQSINFKRSSLNDLINQDSILKNSHSFVTMEKDEKKLRFEKEMAFTTTTTPSFSRRLGENIKEIPEQNESLDEEIPSNPKHYENYKSRKSSDLFSASKYQKKDSESIVTEVEKNVCCLKQRRKNEKGMTTEKTVCKMSPCRIF